MVEELKRIISEEDCLVRSGTVLDVISSLLNNCKEEYDLNLPVRCFAPSFDDPFYFGDGPYNETERKGNEIILKFKQGYWC